MTRGQMAAFLHRAFAATAGTDATTPDGDPIPPALRVVDFPEREALFVATDGHNWYNNTGWLTEPELRTYIYSGPGEFDGD